MHFETFHLLQEPLEFSRRQESAKMSSAENESIAPDQRTLPLPASAKTYRSTGSINVPSVTRRSFFAGPVITFLPTTGKSDVRQTLQTSSESPGPGQHDAETAKNEEERSRETAKSEAPSTNGTRCKIGGDSSSSITKESIRDNVTPDNSHSPLVEISRIEECTKETSSHLSCSSRATKSDDTATSKVIIQCPMEPDNRDPSRIEESCSETSTGPLEPDIQPLVAKDASETNAHRSSSSEATKSQDTTIPLVHVIQPSDSHTPKCVKPDPPLNIKIQHKAVKSSPRASRNEDSTTTERQTSTYSGKPNLSTRSPDASFTEKEGSPTMKILVDEIHRRRTTSVQDCTLEAIVEASSIQSLIRPSRSSDDVSTSGNSEMTSTRLKSPSPVGKKSSSSIVVSTLGNSEMTSSLLKSSTIGQKSRSSDVVSTLGNSEMTSTHLKSPSPVQKFRSSDDVRTCGNSNVVSSKMYNVSSTPEIKDNRETREQNAKPGDMKSLGVTVIGKSAQLDMVSGLLECWHCYDKGSFGVSSKIYCQKNRSVYGRKKFHEGLDPRTLDSEVRIMVSCSQENLVKVFGWYRSSNQTLNIIMELCVGGNLEDRLRLLNDTLLPENQLLEWFRQIVLAIEYLHYRNILHRNLKPTNVLFAGPDHLKVVDFGVANIFCPKMDFNKHLENTPYIAPEAYTGYCSQSDIWALCCVLADMATLKNYSIKILEQHLLYIDIHVSSIYSDAVAELVWMGVKIDPSQRSSATQIRRQCNKLLGGLSLCATG